MSLNLHSILPMLCTVGGALLLLFSGLFRKRWVVTNQDSLFETKRVEAPINKPLWVIFCMLILSLSFILLFIDMGYETGFFDILERDGISYLGQMIILIGSILLLPLSLIKERSFEGEEFFILYLLMTASFQFMVSTSHLVLMYVALESGSLCMYSIIALSNKERSIEAAIKYFTMGALASGFFAFGMMLVYAELGDLNLVTVQSFRISFHSIPLMLISFSTILVAIAFKISLFPFHSWVPDVYDGSNAFVAGYISVVPKIAGFIIAFRLLHIFLDLSSISDLLYIAVCITTTVPNMIALIQSDIKRMLAYSSISHAGFILSMILVGSLESVSTIFIYWTLFLVTNIGAFSMLFYKHHFIRCGYGFNSFNGLIKKHPVFCITMSIFMLSLAGIPPFALFFGKLQVIINLIMQSSYFIACILLLNSGISCFYYIRLLVHMLLLPPSVDDNDTNMIKYNKNSGNIILIKASIFICAFLAISAVFYIDSIAAFILHVLEFVP